MKAAAGRANLVRVVHSAAHQLNEDMAKIAEATPHSPSARAAVRRFNTHLQALVVRVEETKPSARSPKYYRLTIQALHEYATAGSLLLAAQHDEEGATAGWKHIGAAIDATEKARQRQAKAEKALNATWGF